MSAAADLDDLMKVINSKFRAQRRLFDQEKQELLAKLESSEKRLRERDGDNVSLREQLLTAKKRSLELEKLVVDQNSLIQRMRSKLQVSFDSSFNGSDSGAAARGRAEKPVLEDKCISTDGWHAVLEKELAERIERYAAYMREQESKASRSNGRLSLSEQLASPNRSRLDQQRSGHASLASLSRFTNQEFDKEYAGARSSSKMERIAQQERVSHSVIENGIAEHAPLSLAVRGRPTPATSVWQASTPLSDRHSRNGEREFSNHEHSLPFDDTLRDLPNNLDDASALEADLMQRFSELETEAQALFDLDDLDDAENAMASKDPSVVNDL